MSDEKKRIEDVPIGELVEDLFRLKNLKDPSFWCCCLFPVAVVLFVVIGFLYRFARWAFS